MPRRAARTLARALLLAVLSSHAAIAQTPPAKPPGPSLDMKPGQEIVFAVTVSEADVTLGKPRVSSPGTATPSDGEIAVSIVKHGLDPYADLTATEKTNVPIDFVATSLVGEIKIDEVRLCGRLDAPLTAHVAGGAWRISLNRFRVGGKGAPGCP